MTEPDPDLDIEDKDIAITIDRQQERPQTWTKATSSNHKANTGHLQQGNRLRNLIPTQTYRAIRRQTSKQVYKR